MPNEKEVRLAQIDPSTIEIREDENDSKMIIQGYAAVFESPTMIGSSDWGYTEKIARGAFDGADMKDVVLRYNHSDEFAVLARTRNKSLTLMTDEKGLLIKAELLDTTDGKDMYKRVKAGLIDKMSFAFTVKEEEWNSESRSRTIKKFDRIFDVALVDFPAYDDTEVYARSLEKAKEFIEERKPAELPKEIQKLILMYN